jgi:alpha-mannosidase
MRRLQIKLKMGLLGAVVLTGVAHAQTPEKPGLSTQPTLYVVDYAHLAKGQTIDLPSSHYNRIYLLAASANGDQEATFEAWDNKTKLNIQDWSGFIGQWDNRQWSSNDTAHAKCGEMTGLTPGFVKRANLAWSASHHHDAAGKNVDCADSCLFRYVIDLPPSAKTIKLPSYEIIHILAISMADESPKLKPARALYDERPSEASRREPN